VRRSNAAAVQSGWLVSRNRFRFPNNSLHEFAERRRAGECAPADADILSTWAALRHFFMARRAGRPVNNSLCRVTRDFRRTNDPLAGELRDGCERGDDPTADGDERCGRAIGDSNGSCEDDYEPDGRRQSGCVWRADELRAGRASRCRFSGRFFRHGFCGGCRLPSSIARLPGDTVWVTAFACWLLDDAKANRRGFWPRGS
jgi:hypothetical protein